MRCKHNGMLPRACLENKLSSSTVETSGPWRTSTLYVFVMETNLSVAQTTDPKEPNLSGSLRIVVQRHCPVCSLRDQTTASGSAIPHDSDRNPLQINCVSIHSGAASVLVPLSWILK